MQCDADVVESLAVVEPFAWRRALLESAVDVEVLGSCEEEAEEGAG